MSLRELFFVAEPLFVAEVAGGHGKLSISFPMSVWMNAPNKGIIYFYRASFLHCIVEFEPKGKGSPHHTTVGHAPSPTPLTVVGSVSGM